eukprot:scaffold46317_cov70-Phaeocystis_antarctica.AAC.2
MYTRRNFATKSAPKACEVRAARREVRTQMRPVVPRYAVLTARPRLVCVGRAYSSACPRGKLPCACGTYSTQEADTRIPYAQYGGPGAYV